MKLVGLLMCSREMWQQPMADPIYVWSLQTPKVCRHSLGCSWMMEWEWDGYWLDCGAVLSDVASIGVDGLFLTRGYKSLQSCANLFSEMLQVCEVLVWSLRLIKIPVSDAEDRPGRLGDAWECANLVSEMVQVYQNLLVMHEGVQISSQRWYKFVKCWSWRLVRILVSDADDGPRRLGDAWEWSDWWIVSCLRSIHWRKMATTTRAWMHWTFGKISRKIRVILYDISGRARATTRAWIH